MLGSSMRVQVSGRADQIARHLAKAPHSERGTGLDGKADRSIETFPEQIRRRVVKMKIDRNVGVEFKKLREQWRHMRGAE